MRKFSSYGPINTKQNYYVSREALIERAYTQLVGENPDEGGHYMTVVNKTFSVAEVMLVRRSAP